MEGALPLEKGRRVRKVQIRISDQGQHGIAIIYIMNERSEDGVSFVLSYEVSNLRKK